MRAPLAPHPCRAGAAIPGCSARTSDSAAAALQSAARATTRLRPRS